jgi:hypothetical protein
VKQDVEKIEVVGYSAAGASSGSKPGIALAKSVARIVKVEIKAKKVKIKAKKVNVLGGGIGSGKSNYVMINLIEKATQNTQGK